MQVETEKIRKKIEKGLSKGIEECIVIVELSSVDQKREVIEKKKKLKGRTERIVDNLPWKKRKMQKKRKNGS